MLKTSGLEFARAAADLRMVELSCKHLIDSQTSVDPANIQHLAGLVAEILGNLKRVCILNNLDDAIGPELERFRLALPRTTLADLQSRADHLRHRLYDELMHEYYFQVDREDVMFYGRGDLIFSAGLSSKFKDAVPDIENAGNCLALQQPDACVFHLMRAMEVMVRQLSRRLNVTVTPSTTWRQMTGNMDVKIKAMPETTVKQKHKKNDWEAARVNLHQVGSVWRNATMHPATSYTRSQARDIYNAVRVFTAGLSAL